MSLNLAADPDQRSKGPWPFYPVLLGAFPVLAIYAANLGMVPSSDLWRPLTWVIGLALSAWIVSSLLLRSIWPGAALSSVAFALFFSYGPMGDLVDSFVVAIVDFGIFFASLVLFIWKKPKLFSATRVLNFGSFVLVLLPIAQIAIQRPPGVHESFLDVHLPVALKQVTDKPDIFFIIVDGYGRSDQIERVMGYSNNEFIESLREKGFYVADRSHSNYCQTQLSLASSLNLSFLQELGDMFPDSSNDRHPLVRGIDESYISSYLKRRGYAYIGVTSGFDEIQLKSTDVSYDHKLAYTMLEDAVVQLTPITLVPFRVVRRFNDRRESLIGAFENLRYLGTPTSHPRFVVAHLLAPHPPFVFDAAGNPIRQPLPFGFWDGSHYMSFGTPEGYRSGYVGQIQYLNKQLLAIIDALVSKAAKPPVIIIEGDHGSKLKMHQDVIDKTDLRECFSNLMAFHVPGSIREKLYPEVSSVNTFRLVLNGLFKENLPLLPDKSYYSPFSRPYQFTEVTERIADVPHRP
jgi:hypothetical protein